MSESAIPSFWRTVGGVVRFLLRLLLIVALGIGIGAGLYYGGPWVYRNVVQPVQHNAFRIDALETRTKRIQTDIQENMRLYDNRIASLETQMGQLQADIGEQAQACDTLSVDLRDVQATVTTNSQQLAQVNQDLSEQADALQAQARTVSEYAASFKQYRKETAKTAASLEGRIGVLELQGADVPAWLNDLAAQIALQQTGQALLKTRLLLLEDNPRAAQTSLAEADNFLVHAIDLLPKQTDLLDLQKRLEQVPELIARRSYRTTAELESLWGMVMDIADQLAPTKPFSAGVLLSVTEVSTVPIVEARISRTVLLSPLSPPLPPQETP